MTRTLALVAAALIAAPAIAFAQPAPGVTASQPVPNPPPGTTAPGPGTADPMYSGALKGSAFLDVEGRIAADEAKMGSNRKAMSALRAIKSEAKVRRARHGGELRDWDRELLNKRLDQVEGVTGA